MSKTGLNAQTRSIRQKISRLLLMVTVSVVLMILIYSVMLLSIHRQYENAILSATTAAEFNDEFKTNIDMSMYHYVIQPRTGEGLRELPMEELDHAQEVFLRLEATTTLPDNRWRARSMLNMLDNLRGYMIEIAGTDAYDMRMDLLDRNIRGETGLTRLIEQYMHDYIDDEVRELARLREGLNVQTNALLLTSFAVMLLLFFLFVFYANRFRRQITAPIASLTEKARRMGERDYSAFSVETEITELKILDHSFDSMAEHINALMDQQLRSERSLHRAQLELLQAQINPHFLYNTLDSIAILAENHREEDVVAMVTSLSTFFRNSLSRGEDVISLRAEVAQATSYLEIQQIRYSDILSYTITVPESARDKLVPKLILQPLIENALYHGVKNRRGRGTIAISGSVDPDGLRLTVRDNGAGMSAEQLAQLRNGVYQETGTGLGLKNVHQRIRLYCGSPYGLYFESEPGQGSTVTIWLPPEGVSTAQKEAYQ